jgi:undecaprenyl-diphosphatase
VSVTLAVLAVAAALAVVVWWMSRHRVAIDPIDPQPQEQWLVRWLGDHPRWGRAVRAVDQKVVGGAMLAVALAVVFGGALVVGLLLDMIDRGSGLARLDRAVADWGSEHATDWTTDVLAAITHLGGTVEVALIAVVVAAVDYRRSRNLHVALFLALVVAGISVVNNVLKWIVGRDRPDVVHLVGASSSSFPSGHSATAAAAWCAFALVASRHRSRRHRAIAAAIAAVITFSVASSRALLGVHWLTDVLAGLTVGWVWFLLVALAFGGRLQRLGEPAERHAVSSAMVTTRVD